SLHCAHSPRIGLLLLQPLAHSPRSFADLVLPLADLPHSLTLLGAIGAHSAASLSHLRPANSDGILKSFARHLVTRDIHGHLAADDVRHPNAIGACSLRRAGQGRARRVAAAPAMPASVSATASAGSNSRAAILPAPLILRHGL